jgi:hypothetical protein
MNDETFVDPPLDDDEFDPSVEAGEADEPPDWPRYCRPGYRALEARLWRVLLVVGAVVIAFGLFLIASHRPTLGVSLIVGAIATLAVLGWRRAQFEFCPRCEARTKCLGPRWSWCPGCNRLNDPSALFLDGPHRLDLSNRAYLTHEDAIVKLLCMILLCVAKDKATEIRFRPGEKEMQCFIHLPDGWHEMFPPPAHLYPYLASVVRCLIAGTDMADVPTLEGDFTLRFENRDHVAQAEVNGAAGQEKFRIRWAA